MVPPESDQDFWLADTVTERVHPLAYPRNLGRLRSTKVSGEFFVCDLVFNVSVD